MKKPLFALWLGCTLLTIVGCAAKRYSEFTGSQNWIVGSQAMADNSYAIPVYRSWPDRPYRVIGSIRFAELNNEWKDGDTAHAARIARSHGGDAIIMRYGGEFGIGAITGAAGDAQVVSMSGVTALVIKWRSPSEVEAEQQTLDRFWSNYRAKHPNRDVSRELVAMGSEYVTSLGMEKGTSLWSDKLGATLDNIIGIDGDKNREWLYRGTIQSSGITTSATDVFYGIAKTTQSGTSITIVSDTGDLPSAGMRHADVNFSGTFDGGKANGQLGFSSGFTIFSGKADGVIAGNKILLNTQGQTSSGVVQGSFIFMQ